MLRFNMKDSRGFTLIEIMVAITLLAFLMISIFNITNNSIDTKDRIVDEDREFLQIQTLFDRLELDFSQIYSPLYFAFPRISPNTPGAQGADIFDEENPPPRYRPTERFPSEAHGQLLIPTVVNEDQQSLVFLSTSNRRKSLNSEQSRFAWIRYTLASIETNDPDDELPEGRLGTMQVMRSAQANDPYRRDFNWDQVRSYSLLKGVKEFRFEFWDRDNKRFVDLLRGLPKDALSPRLLKVSFTWVAPDGVEHFFTRTFRPLFPYFDRDADMTIHLQVMRESAQNRRQARLGPDSERDGDFDRDRDGDEF
jgi:prepilin-type N-terminal cleavage/methylation domain-containing protein